MKAFGTGSFYVEDVFTKEEITHLNSLDRKDKYVARNAEGMKMRDSELRRSKRFFVAGGEPLVSTLKRKREDKWERYYYTGWTWASMQHYERIQDEPVILQVTKRLARQYNTNFNHVILTRYDRDPTGKKDDSIGFHYDKPKDLDPSAPIVVLTLGVDLREFVVRQRFPTLPSEKKEIFRIVPQPGSIIYMTAKDNLNMEHAVVPTKEEAILKRRDIHGCRMSLVFRKSITLVTQSEIDQHLVKYRSIVKAREELRKNWVAIGNIVHNKLSNCPHLTTDQIPVTNAKGKRLCTCIKI